MEVPRVIERGEVVFKADQFGAQNISDVCYAIVTHVEPNKEPGPYHYLGVSGMMRTVAGA